MSSRAVGIFQIRNARPKDQGSTNKVHRAAFDSPAEAQLVELLRKRGKASISLIAEIQNQIAGHILFSPVSLEPPASGWYALGLAPIGVLPQHQGQGIGSALINTGLQQCRSQGVELVFVLGDPGYYSRFGFRRADDFGFSNEYQAREHFQVHELIPGMSKKYRGLVKYSLEFAEIGC